MGKRRAAPVIWLVLMALSALPAIYLNSLFGYLPVLTLGFAGLISLGYAALLRRGLELEGVDRAASCLRGETADLTLGLRNRLPLLCPRVEAIFTLTDLFGNPGERTKAAFPLAPRESRSFPLTVRFDHVGSCRAGLEEIRIYGLFGLCALRLRTEAFCRVEVAPRIHRLSGLSLSEAARTERQRAQIRTSAESLDYAGVREYAFGDPIKTIHWKLSAHAAGYLTKQMESYGNSGISVLLDLESPSYPTETPLNISDCLTEAAVSLCAEARRTGMEYKLLTMDRRGEPMRWTPGDLSSFAQTAGMLPPLSTGGGPDILTLLRSEGRSLYGQANLAVCTARLTRELVQLLLELRLRGRFPLLFFVLSNTVMDDARRAALRPRSLLEEAGIPCYVLRSADDLDGGWQ